MPQSKKLSAVLEFGGRTAASFRQATTSIDKRIDGLGKSITENTKKQAAFRKEMKKLGERHSGYFVAKRQAEALGRETEKLIKKQRRLQRLSKLYGGTMSRLKTLGKNVFLGIGAAIAGAAVGVGRLITSTAAYGDELAKTSKRLGLSVDSLERLRFIAQRSGVENQVLEKSIQKVQIALGEAARNTKGPYAQAFRELGINFKSFSRLRPEEQVAELAGQFGKLTDQTQKTFLANRLWGEEGIKMLQIMDAGKDGITEMTGAFDELGGSIGDKGAAAAVKFQDTLTDLKKQVGTTFHLIAAEALPGATGAMESFTKALQSGDIDVKAIGESLGEMIRLLGKAAEETLEFASTLNTFGARIGDWWAKRLGMGTFGDNETWSSRKTAPRSAGGTTAGTGAAAPSASSTVNAPITIISNDPESAGAAAARHINKEKRRKEQASWENQHPGFSSREGRELVMMRRRRAGLDPTTIAAGTSRSGG